MTIVRRLTVATGIGCFFGIALSVIAFLRWQGEPLPAESAESFYQYLLIGVAAEAVGGLTWGMLQPNRTTTGVRYWASWFGVGCATAGAVLVTGFGSISTTVLLIWLFSGAALGMTFVMLSRPRSKRPGGARQLAPVP